MTEETLFANALEKKTPAERAAFLDECCSGDAALRQRVEALLRSHEQTEFLKKPAVQRAAEAVAGEAVAVTTEALACGGDDHAVSLDFLAPSDKPDSLGRLGHYEVLKVIGRGGMGVVLRAFDEKLHRVVAIKVMAAQLATNAAARERFRREARAAAAVSHDHIVTFHAVEEANGLPYLVMQYVSGVSLQERLDREGPLRLQEVLRIGMQTAAGLAAAHAQGLIHRDVKPANILLENGVERVKITDFGLARAAADASLTQSGVAAGTPQYMSPEQARGEAVDPRSDLFSLGSTLYAMCTGRPPFRANSAVAVLKRVCDDTPTPIRESNAEIPDWLVAIIDKLHAKEPADRFQSAAEVADLLGRYLAHLQQPAAAPLPAGITVVVHPKGARGSEAIAHSDRARRGRRRWLVAAAVLVACCGGLSLTEASGVTSLRATVIRLFTGDGTLVVEVNDPGVKVSIEGDGGLVITGAGPQEVRLRPGSYKLQAAKDGKPVPLDQELVTITRGDKRVVRVAVEANRRDERAHPAFVTPWSDSDDWVVEGQELVQPRTQNSHLLFGDPSWTDYNFEADVQITAGGEASLLFRAPGSNARLHASLLLATEGIRDKGSLSVLAVKDYVIAVLHAEPRDTTRGRWYRMRIEARGAKFKVFLDGQRIASVYHEGFPRGCVGLQTNTTSARFRNLKVTDPSGRVLLEGLDNVLPKPKAASASSGNRAAAFSTPWVDSDDWVIEGNELHQRDESQNGHLFYFGDPRWTDYDFEAEALVGPGDFNEVGLIFRATRSDDRLYGCIGAFGNTVNAMLAARNGFGAFAQTPGKAEKGRWYRLRVETRGGRFNMFLDGKRILTGRKDGFPRGRVGLITVGASARFRNPKVTDPAGKVLLEGWPSALPKAKDLAYREVGAALEQAVRKNQDDDEAHFALGFFCVQWGEWKKAAIAYDRGLELNPADSGLWMQAAGVHLASGDLEGYRRTCREMLQRFGDTKDPLAGERTASACLMLPDAVTPADYERVQKLAELAVTGTETHGFYRYYMRTKALADYRAERFAEAIKWLEKCAPKSNGDPDDATMFAIPSMALAGLGRSEEAAAALASAKAIAVKFPDPARGQPQGGRWHQHLVARHECHLAEALLSKK